MRIPRELIIDIDGNFGATADLAILFMLIL